MSSIFTKFLLKLKKNSKILVEAYMLRLKELREDHDLRQSDIAKATGIDQKTISNYETGKTRPDSDALILLADYFGVSIDYLVGRKKLNCQNVTDIKNELKKCIKNLYDIEELL